jgi:hypothetical protein
VALDDLRGRLPKRHAIVGRATGGAAASPVGTPAASPGGGGVLVERVTIAES